MKYNDEYHTCSVNQSLQQDQNPSQMGKRKPPSRIQSAKSGNHRLSKNFNNQASHKNLMANNNSTMGNSTQKQKSSSKLREITQVEDNLMQQIISDEGDKVI